MTARRAKCADDEALVVELERELAVLSKRYDLLANELHDAEQGAAEWREHVRKLTVWLRGFRVTVWQGQHQMDAPLHEQVPVVASAAAAYDAYVREKEGRPAQVAATCLCCHDGCVETGCKCRASGGA